MKKIFIEEKFARMTEQQIFETLALECLEGKGFITENAEKHFRGLAKEIYFSIKK